MPKLPRTSGAAIVKAHERLGFVRVRQSGSHVIMRRGPKGCVVPMHSEVKDVRLALLPCINSICRTAVYVTRSYGGVGGRGREAFSYPEWGTSGFDSVYLELARRLNLPIAGKDKPLLAAGAAKAGVPVFAP